eukprot:s4096_g1.t1
MQTRSTKLAYRQLSMSAQAGHEEKYDKDLTNQDETHGWGKATQEDNAVCCRCHRANGMKLPDTRKLNPPCYSGCYEVPMSYSSSCGSWASLVHSCRWRPHHKVHRMLLYSTLSD